MSSLALTDRQRNDLNVAIYEYMVAQGDKFLQSAELFRSEAKLGSVEIGKGLLEKKWTSVVRLQKRVMELESKVEQLQQQRVFGTEPIAHSAVTKVESSLNNELRLLPKPPAKNCFTGHRASVTIVITHPVYSMIASGSEDTTIRIWDHETNQYERTLKGHTGAITGLAFDTRGLILASSSTDMSAKLWDMNTFACMKTLKGHDHTISCIRFLSSGDTVVTASRDQMIKFWEVSTGYCSKTLSGHTDWIKSICISLDGLYLASGGVDQNILIWQISTGSIVQTLRGHEHVVETVSYGKKATDAIALAHSPSKISEDSVNEFSFLASGSRDRTVRLWDPLRATCLMTFTAHENWVRCVIIHPNGKFIISCSDDKTIRVLDIKEGRCMRTITDAHSHFITSISLSCNYPILVSGSVDRNVSVWLCS